MDEMNRLDIIKELNNILSEIKYNKYRKEVLKEAIDLLEIPNVEKIYNAGYEDGLHDGYNSTIIERGTKEEHYGKSLKELVPEIANSKKKEKKDNGKYYFQRYYPNFFDVDPEDKKNTYYDTKEELMEYIDSLNKLKYDGWTICSKKDSIYDGDPMYCCMIIVINADYTKWLVVGYTNTEMYDEYQHFDDLAHHKE